MTQQSPVHRVIHHPRPGRFLVVTPTYNERATIETLIEQVLALDPGFAMLIVDDGSPDGTGTIVEAIAQRNARVRIIHRPCKLGLGSAYLTGFRAALSTDAEVILQMDADLQHKPADLLRLVAALADADVAIGSRRADGGGSEGWSWGRRLISAGGSLLARTILAHPVRDMTSGFKAFRRHVLETLPLDCVRANGFAFQIEMTYLCHRYGFRIKEVPITFSDRVAGRSKMDSGIIVEALFTLARLRLQDFVRPRPVPSRSEPGPPPDER